MNKKYLIPLAIIAVLPLTAKAENISGAMYAAPAAADTNHPAPTTAASGPYGRIDIDTADQDHIATTAYVKGAYNSAIAAVNSVGSRVTELEEKELENNDTGAKIDNFVLGATGFMENFNNIGGYEDTLATAAAVGIGIKSQRVEVYTTWDDDSDTAEVPLITASQN